MKSLRDNLALVGFILSTTALAIVYYLFQRRGQKISELTYDLLKERLDTKLEAAKAKVTKDGEHAKQSSDAYSSLLSRYDSLAKKLGVGPHSNRDKAND